MLVALWLVASVVAVGSSPAGAQEACDLIDDYGALSDAAGLAAAIQSAEAETGVDFAVYATDMLPEGPESLDARMAAEVRIACEPVFESPANVADNTVLLGVSVGDRHTVVSYGDDLDERLDDDANDIVSRMNDFFSNGEISAGLASGVGGTVEGLDTTPPDYATPIGVGVVGTAAVVGGGAWLYARRRTHKSAGEVARSTFEGSSGRVTDVQARWYDAEQEAVIVGGRITGAAMARLDAAQVVAAEASRTLYEAWSPVSEVTGEGVAGMGEEHRAEVEAHVLAALAVVEDAEEKTGALEAVIEELRTKPDDLAALYRTAEEKIRVGLSAGEQRATEGWIVESAQQRLADLSGLLSGMDPFSMRIDVDEIEKRLQPVVDEIDSVAGDLEALEARHAETGQRRGLMDAEIEGQRGRTMQLRAKLSTWATEHATASFEELLGHPDEAERQLGRAEASVHAARQIGEIPRDVKIMRMVNAELDKAQAGVDLADELLDEGDEMDVLLSAAREGAGSAVAGSADDAQLLINFVFEHRSDVPTRAADVAARVGDLQSAAESALRLNPADYLLAMELAGQIESIVNTELTEYQATVGERERVRNQARTAVRSAKVAVDRADRHVQSHMFSSRADRDAQQSIDSLRRDLDQTVVALESDPATAEKAAQSIERAADDIYREAQRRQRYRGGPFGGGFAGGVIIGGGGFRGHGGGRSHRGGGWGGGGGGGFGGGFGGGSSGGWGGGGGGFGGGASGGW